MTTTIQKVRGFYGAKYAIPYNIATGVPCGVFRVLQEVNFERKVEFNDLNGGDSMGAWDSEMGQPENSISMTLKEYPNFAFSLLEDATVTENAAEASGYVGTASNKTGTSIVAATGITAAPVVKSAKKANLPAGRVVLKATAATKLKVYVVGLPKGDGTFILDDASVVAEITVSTGATVDIDNIGITLTGGASATAFTIGDTAIFDVRPVNNGSSIVTVGSTNSSADEFGLMLVFPQKSDGQLYYIDIFRVKAFGMPFKSVTRDWSDFQLSGKVIYDSTNDGLYKAVMLSANA